MASISRRHSNRKLEFGTPRCRDTVPLKADSKLEADKFSVRHTVPVGWSVEFFFDRTEQGN